MKKKFHVFFSITMLALCVGAIAIGVYSAKRVSLNISGNVGFSVHNCDVTIEGYMYGHTDTLDGKPILEEDKVALTSESINTNGGDVSLSLGDFYFSDLGASGRPESIVIELTITNQSKFEVLVDDITNFANDNIEVVCLNNLVVLYTDTDKTATVKYFLDVKPNAEGKYTAITDKIEIPLALDFSKLPEPDYDNFTFDATDDTIITGVPAKTDSDLLVIPSTFPDGTQATTLKGEPADDVSLLNVYEYSKVVILKGITNIDGAFTCTPNLKSVAMPNTVTNIGYRSFYECNFNSIFIPSSVETISEGAFSWFNSKRIEVDSTNTNYDSRDNCNAIIEKETNTLIRGSATTIIPEGVTRIGDSAFDYCTSLTSVTLPRSVNTIGDHAFYGCDSLTSITIPSSVTTIGESAFNDCTSLTSVTFEGASESTTWRVTDYNGTVRNPSVSVSEPTTNATNLKRTYYDCTWKKISL